ncbi:MAG: aldose 1-epimerase family protein [Bacillota bacterium]|nr:aldose 1-epimerase family protein [Bacillota bacterium]
MAKMVTIQNEDLKMVISTLDAEAQSITDGEREFLWQNPTGELWADHSPVLFPICSKLKDDRYFYDGKWYHMKKHGFSKGKEFEVETLDKDRAVFLLKADDETKVSYPFDYEFRVEYKLSGRQLITTYSVLNKSEKVMPVSFGSHEAYACPEGIEEYEIEFPNDDYIELDELKDGLLTGNTEKIYLTDRKLHLTHKDLDPESYVIKNHKSRKLILRHIRSGREITVEFPGIDYLVLWTMEKGDYICIEPWASYIDRADTDGDIMKREGIMPVKSNESISRTHTITF